MFFVQLNYTKVQEAVLFLSTASPYCVRLSKHFELGSLSTNIDFSFDDRTPGEIQSDDISRIKAVLTQKIKEADYTLVLVGKDCCREHPDSKEIGYTNWQVYEIEKSKESGNKIIAVKINLRYEMPKELRHAYVSLAKTFSRSAIKQAIDTAAKSR